MISEAREGERRRQRATTEARAARAWEPTPGELARLLLLAERDEDLRVSRGHLSQWSFFRHSNPYVHLTFCDETGCAFVTVVAHTRGRDVHVSHSVAWVTRADGLRAIGVDEAAVAVARD